MKISRISVGITTFFLTLLLAGCNLPPPPPQKTPLEIEAMQTQRLQTSKKIAFDSTITVFQDLGYIIQSANYDTGFITAKSPTQKAGGGSGGGDDVFSALIDLGNALNNNSHSDNNDYNSSGSDNAATMRTIYATAFVEQLSPKTASVRLNFVRHIETSGRTGQNTSEDKPIEDAQMYQNAFTRIQQAVFVRVNSR